MEVPRNRIELVVLCLNSYTVKSGIISNARRF